MQRVIIALLTLLVAFLTMPSTAIASFVPSDPDGTISGTFSVDGNGAATYSVPITIPPGTHDVAPHLNLIYNSQQINGYVGLGWTLNGISAITRCAYMINESSETEFRKIGVTLTDTDHFCLDGIELVAVQGDYGQDQTIYHTKKETWTKVISHGQCGIGPCYFDAYNKDGGKLEFGTTTGNTGSRILAQGRTDGTVRVWGIAQYTDLNSNYTQVSYINHGTSNGEYYPSRIDYTGNATTGLNPQRSIRFEYQTRPDATMGYVAGSQVHTTQRLSHIKTFVGSQAALDYRLTYTTSPATERSRLTSLQQCDAQQVCLPATQLVWVSQQGPSWFNTPAYNTTRDTTGQWLAMAINGNGRADIVNIYTRNNREYLAAYLAAGNGEWMPAPVYETTSSYDGEWFAMDVNGNNMSDLVKVATFGSKTYFYAYLATSNGQWQAAPTFDTPNNGSENKWLSTDVNGDGRFDLINIYQYGSGTRIQPYLSTGDGTWQLIPYFSTVEGSYEAQWLPIDINGDGMSDVVNIFPYGGKTYFISYLSQGNGTWETAARFETQQGDGQTQWVPLDVNGDAKIDIVNIWVSSNTERFSAYLATGKGDWQALSTFNTQRNTYGEWVPMDANGDGMIDLINIFDSNASKDHFLPYFSQGASDWTVGTEFNTNNAVHRDDDWIPMDVNGVGVVSLVNVFNSDDTNTKQLLTYPSTLTQASDLVSAITNGLNGSTTIEHAPLTDNSLYSKNGTAMYPIRIEQNAMYVVQGYTNQDGIGTGVGHEHHYRYQYAGARVDLRGHGWLGFATVTMIDGADDRSSTITYRQDYPYNGNVQRSETHDHNNNLLTSSEFEYLILGTPYRTHGAYQVLRTVEMMSHYTSGATDYTLKKQYHYDSYGNMQLLEDLGNLADPQDDVFSCTRYFNNTSQWQLGYTVQEKSTQTLAACQNFVNASDPSTIQWHPETDLVWNQIAYDSQMNVTSQAAWYYNPLLNDNDPTHNKWITTAFQYDAYGNRTHATDPLGHTATIAYDTTYHTFPHTITTPPNAHNTSLVTTEQYEPLFGRKTQHQDPNDNMLYYDIDGFGRLVNSYGSNAAGQKTLLTQIQRANINGKGLMVTTQQRPDWDTDAVTSWYWQRSYFDGLEREYRTENKGLTSNTSIVKDIQFNAEGQVGQQSMPYFSNELPAWVTLVYDIYNRPTLTTKPDGTQEKLEYRQGGLIVSRTSAYGTADARTEIVTSNVSGKVTQKTQANGLVSDYTYDKMNRLVTLRTNEPDERQIDFIYDSLGRVVQKTTSNTGSTTLSYDDAGNLLTRTDAAGYVLHYTYDSLNRVLTKTSTAGSDTTTTTFSYDDVSHQNGKGNLTQVVIQPPSRLSLTQWQYDYGYDAHDRLTTGQVSMPLGTYSYALVYDPLGRLQQYTYPDGTQQNIAYAADGNLNTLSLNNTPYVTYSRFNALGEVQDTQYNNGVTVTHGYYPLTQALGKLQSIQVVSSQQSNQTLFSKHYTWNKLNAITQIQDGLNAAHNESFTYDDMGFLTNASGPYGNNVHGYDKLGNVTNNNGSAYTYQINTDKLTRDTEEQVDFAYYANGQLQQKVAGSQIWQYHYDAEGQLLQVAKGTQAGNAFYDHTNQRVYHQPIGQTAKTYYVTPSYEVTDFGNGQVQHTKYLDGLFGKAVAMTDSSTGVVSAVEYNNARIQSQLYAEIGHSMGALLSFKTVDTSLAMSDLRQLWLAVQYYVNAWLPHYNLAAWLNTLVLLAGLGLFLWLCIRGAAEHSTLGVLRLKVVTWLVHIGWLNAEHATHWQSAYRTEFSQHNPYMAALVPFIVTVFFCTFGIRAEAALTPGENGAGYPVQGIYYFVHNQVHSTTVVTDANGAEIAYVAYLPFGNLDQPRSHGEDNFRPKFSGKEWDYDSQLYYFGARYYDPTRARFITPDPAHQYMSPYLYASDSPESYIDPDGQFAISAIIAIISIIVGAIAGAYMGAAAVNHDFNPAHWDWKSGKTWAGLLGGAVIGGIGAYAGAAAAEAGVAAGIAGAAVIGAGENAAFTAMGGGSAKDIFKAAAMGAAFGGVFGAAGTGVGRVIGRFARGSAAAAEEGGEMVARGVRRVESGVCASFVKGTLVQIAANHPVAIEAIALGDHVYAYDKVTAATNLHAVTALYNRTVGKIVNITTTSGETIQTTAEHPFWVYNKGWIAAAQLSSRHDELTNMQGEPVKLQAVEIIALPQPVTVHNFSVDKAHNYYVSSEQVLVHNPNVCVPKGTQIGRDPTQLVKGGQIDLEELGEIIPSNTPDIWGAGARTPEGGFKYEWETMYNGKLTRFHAHGHGPDLNPAAGSNASSGWVVRIKTGNKFLMTTGATTRNLNLYANETHIPLAGVPQPGFFNRTVVPMLRRFYWRGFKF